MSTDQPTEPATVRVPLASVTDAPFPRGMIVILGVVGVVVLGTGIRGAAGIVAPTMLSLVLTIAVLPIGSWARKHGWPSWLATLLALVAAYAILLVLVVGTIVCLVKLVDLLPQYSKDAKGITDQVHSWLSSLGLNTESTSDALKNVHPSKVADILGSLLSGILGAIGGLFFLVTVMFFFMVAVRGFEPRMAGSGARSPSSRRRWPSSSTAPRTTS